MKTWRYEPETKTIRSVPENYWLATMDSWDGAVNHEANARLIAAAPELLWALQNLVDCANLIAERWESGDLADAIRSLQTDAKFAAQAIAKAV